MFCSLNPIPFTRNVQRLWGDQLTGRYMEFPLSMHVLLMLVLWSTNRPTASSCTRTALQAPPSRLSQSWFSSAVVVCCRFHAFVGVSIPALSWNHVGTTYPKLLYAIISPSPTSTSTCDISKSTSMTPNVPTLCVHSSPSSPFVTQSTSCSMPLDGEASTTLKTQRHHLPYCHPYLALSSSDETCSIVLDPHTPPFNGAAI